MLHCVCMCMCVSPYSRLQDPNESLLYPLTDLTSFPTTYFNCPLLLNTKDISASVFASVLFSAENTLHPDIFKIHSLGSLLKNLPTEDVPDHVSIHICTHIHILFICHTLVFSIALTPPDILQIGHIHRPYTHF